MDILDRLANAPDDGSVAVWLPEHTVVLADQSAASGDEFVARQPHQDFRVDVIHDPIMADRRPQFPSCRAAAAKSVNERRGCAAAEGLLRQWARVSRGYSPNRLR